MTVARKLDGTVRHPAHRSLPHPVHVALARRATSHDAPSVAAARHARDAARRAAAGVVGATRAGRDACVHAARVSHADGPVVTVAVLAAGLAEVVAARGARSVGAADELQAAAHSLRRVVQRFAAGLTRGSARNAPVRRRVEVRADRVRVAARRAAPPASRPGRIRAAGVSVEALIRGRAAGLAESPTAAAAPLVTDAQVLRARSALRRADARNAAATACAGGERVTRCECLGVAGAGACLVRGARVTGTRSTVTGAGLAVRRSRVGEPAFAAGPSSVRHARIRFWATSV